MVNGCQAGLGAPIPTRIADQLRGKNLAGFDAFRKVFWKAIASDSKLSGLME
ncbi:hypothetical protein [Pseudomonas fluorescens]|uniref:hypothetical protein n=1 Tax=Pseudomonas fluorescens TaxID=294 RepID=UPI002E7B6BF2|nr:hypothetical protein [Pseudomonas fluorescens]